MRQLLAPLRCGPGPQAQAYTALLTVTRGVRKLDQISAAYCGSTAAGGFSALDLDRVDRPRPPGFSLICQWWIQKRLAGSVLTALAYYLKHQLTLAKVLIKPEPGRQAPRWKHPPIPPGPLTKTLAW